ncbi:MAG TPA: AtpZ/AtpI family protein [Candidatus Angelobacter sp.]|jgi:F0F1-type ATP synthase assembly protein I
MLASPIANSLLPQHNVYMPQEPPSPKKQWVAAEKYLQLGITIPAATFVGWLIGAGLDRWMGSHSLALGGLILGTVAGFVYFIRTAISEDFKD